MIKRWKLGLCIAVLGAASMSTNAQEDNSRFKRIPVSEMTPAQKTYFEMLMAGPVSGTGSAAVQQGATSVGAPFNVYLRSPELAQKLLAAAEQIRFHSSLPPKLNEFAILVTARHWTAQFEWYAHHRLALKAGLEASVAADLALGKRPATMTAEEAAIYDFSYELHNNHGVSDAAFKAVVDKFGERGVVDLIAVNGYYVLVSMILNVNRTPLPGGVEPPLAPLK